VINCHAAFKFRGTSGLVDMTETVTPEIRCRVGIELLGGFRFITDGIATLDLAEGSQRLLALLALHPGSLTRPGIAGVLWPDASDRRAFASLRSALARMSAEHRDGLLVRQRDLSLANGVTVDVLESRQLAERLISPEIPSSECDLSAEAISAFSEELLPGWYDDWVVVAGEKWRQLRLHALEALAERLAREGRCGEAIVAALAAIQAEPLRESAHALLIRLHLQEGNQSEALLAFRRYQTLLREELGLKPTARITALVYDLERAVPGG
jgi:DNA-binding SARP family transcriptional activator